MTCTHHAIDNDTLCDHNLENYVVLFLGDVWAALDACRTEFTTISQHKHTLLDRGDTNRIEQRLLSLPCGWTLYIDNRTDHDSEQHDGDEIGQNAATHLDSNTTVAGVCSPAQ